MNIFKAMAVKDLEEATRAIPVIDVAPAFRGEPGGLEAVAAQVRRASEQVGFFYLAGHGVPETLIDSAFAASREFHAMPLAEKLALKLNENNIGYLPVNESIQRASTVHKATRPNFNESFFISHERGADHPDVRGGHAAARPQPVAGGPRPDARGDGRATSRRWRPSASACCPCWPARSRCPPDSSRRPSRTRPTSTCASCTTRPQEIDDPEQFGQGPHTDNSFITILAREDVPGLAVRLPSGEWLAPPLIPGDVPGQPRQHDEAVVERPLPLHAPRCAERLGTRPLLDRVLLQPDRRRDDRVPAELHVGPTIPPRYEPARLR